MNDKQQEVIAELQRIAALLNVNSLTRREFSENSKISVETVENRFGSWNRAIEAAGLVPNAPRLIYPKPTLTDDNLLEEIMRLALELNKTPTEREMNALGRYSVKPYRNRWGKFSEAVRVAYTKYGVPDTIPESALIPSADNIPPTNISPNRIVANNRTDTTRPARKKIQYGEPIDFRGLRHAPVNEQGVVYVFGMVSRELGFLIESVRTAYPDCEGKRCVDEKRQLWENVLIEFEFRSSNFREHGHNPQECDLIVCWIHDWADCPLEVLELRSALAYLHSK